MPSPASTYDVVLVGTQLAPLVAGALLAKRGFRVLLVSQGELPPMYEPAEGLRLPREPFTLTAAGSPVTNRIFTELALHQLLRRKAAQIDPAFQVCLPRHRFDLPREPSLLEREIEREFSEIKRPIEDLMARMANHDARIDAILEQDLMWPPQSFFERREYTRATSDQPFGKAGDALDPLAEFPENHAVRLVVDMPARFSDGMDPDHGTGLRLNRLFHAWRKGAIAIDGGFEAVRELLLSSIRTHGGDIRAPERIDAVRVKRGSVTGVRLFSSGEEVGATWVVFGESLASILRLVPDRAPFEEMFERIGEPVVRYYRYTLNLIVAAEGMPSGLSRDAFFVRDPRRPRNGANALRVEREATEDPDRVRLTVSALIPRRGIEDTPDYAATLRERIVASLGELLPFLGDHLLLMDSPHDGRGVQDLEHRLVLPANEPWNRGTATMRLVHGYPVPSGLGVCALPVRTSIRRLLLCNDQVVPGLGQEGEFMAAWSAARVIERSDRKKERMRRGRWGKLEL